jgi:hypothetical protein
MYSVNTMVRLRVMVLVFLDRMRLVLTLGLAFFLILLRYYALDFDKCNSHRVPPSCQNVPQNG